MTDVICPGPVYQTQQGGHVLYRDTNHLSAPFALALPDDLERRIAPEREARDLRGTPVTLTESPVLTSGTER